MTSNVFVIYYPKHKLLNILIQKIVYYKLFDLIPQVNCLRRKNPAITGTKPPLLQVSNQEESFDTHATVFGDMQSWNRLNHNGNLVFGLINCPGPSHTIITIVRSP